jgi:hypothetical protein
LRRLLAGQIEDALGVGVGEHGWEYVPFIRLMQKFDEKQEQLHAACPVPFLEIEPQTIITRTREEVRGGAQFFPGCARQL